MARHLFLLTFVLVCAAISAATTLAANPARDTTATTPPKTPAPAAEIKPKAAAPAISAPALAKTPPAAPAEAATQVDKLLAKEVFSDKSGSDKSGKNKLVASADDATYLRRITLDITGESPSPEEITRFSLDPSPGKRTAAVDRLLASTDFGTNWGRYWRDVILARRSEDRALLGANALTAYLTDEFNKGTPWDKLVRSFITATGDVRENGATAVIMAQMAETADVTAEMSRIFLGVQIACAQCHNHPTDRWKREQFHELAAFFPRVGIRPKRDTAMRSFEVVSVDREPMFRGPNNIFKGSTEHYMPDLKDPAAKGTLMQPVFFLSGEKLSPGRTDQERRAAAANMFTNPKNPWFARAFVNRIWSELVGEGFYEPVDDIGPDRQCEAPATLDYLAGQFVTHGHDVKWLFRTITMTAAYQRQSRTRHNPDETPFTANCPQRLRADQVYEALTAALGIPAAVADPLLAKAAPLAAQRSPRGQFDATFGYDPSTRRDEVAGSIPQALLMMNAPEVNRPLNGRAPNTSLGKLVSETKNDEAVVVELYLRSLAREPKDTELKTCLNYVKKVGNRSEAFEDILWSLVNSTEFLHRK